jgi:hypothetical protein
MAACLLIAPILLALLPTPISSPLTRDDPEKPKLKMTEAIACSKVDGYEQYEPLEDATLTADEKLFVYYKPLNYHVERKGNLYRAYLTQDARIRPHGKKTVLRRKDDLMKYEVKEKSEPTNLFISNFISLKDLPPGDYDLDIILHDRVGDEANATQVLPFRIKAAPTAAEKKDDKTEKSKDAEKKSTPNAN